MRIRPRTINRCQRMLNSPLWQACNFKVKAVIAKDWDSETRNGASISIQLKILNPQISWNFVACESHPLFSDKVYCFPFAWRWCKYLSLARKHFSVLENSLPSHPNHKSSNYDQTTMYTVRNEIDLQQEERKYIWKKPQELDNMY